MSYSWRGIWNAKSLLLVGLKWRVGNGNRISVWHDVWLLGNSSSIVPTPLPGANRDMKVAELIDNDRCWKNDVLVATFLSHDIALIKQIPLN